MVEGMSARQSSPSLATGLLETRHFHRQNQLTPLVPQLV
jgi:hypothetical protein